MTDIVLERDERPSIMKLESDEQALLDEIQISTEKPMPRRKPPSRRKPPIRRQMHEYENIEAFTNPTKMSAPSRPPPEEVMDHGDNVEEDEEMMPDFDDESEGGYEGGGGGGGNRPSTGYSSIDDEKADLLNKLTRLEKKGFSVNKKLNAYSNIDELRTEYKRIKYSIEVDQSLKFSRRMLIACVTGVEFLNKRYNPLDVQLEGWSESVMENVDDYDGVFEELYSKYKTKIDVAPEVKLIMMLGGSAMMFHLTNSMFKAAVPNMNDVMKQNPDLVKNMISAVQNTSTPSSRVPEDPTMRPVDSSGRKEMRGPGLDLSSLMGGISMPPPQPMSSTAVLEERPDPIYEVNDSDDDLSDIVSVAGESTNGEVREVKVSKGRGRKGKKKTEINL